MSNESKAQVRVNKTKPTMNNREIRMDFIVSETNTRKSEGAIQDYVNRIVASGQNPPPRD